MNIDRDEIVHLTETQGKDWGINHVRRLLALIDVIGEDQDYDRDVIWVATHLHDWGAYGEWQQPGVDHVERSLVVAGDYLKAHAYPDDFTAQVMECIATHHSGGPNRSIEAILLSDADALDFLGVIGVLRIFSKNPKALRKAYDDIKKRKEKLLAGGIVLERSKEIAAERAQQMDWLFSTLEANSSGYF
jgi:HD superfamily phosphodiesterase